jgi:hypothetical protein
VHREIKENLSTANMRGRWLSVCRLPTDALVEQEPRSKLEGCRRARDVARSVYSQNERLRNDLWRDADVRGDIVIGVYRQWKWGVPLVG